MLGVATKLAHGFSGLRVRYKLMILHNLFFLVLASGVYFSLMPLIEGWVRESSARETALARKLRSMNGTAALGQRPAGHEELLRHSRIALFLVLGFTYWLGVLILELFVMPVYIYRPLRRLLQANEASRRGDTAGELIDESLILGDEMGQLMRSRNATLRKLRQHERELQEALARLENAKQSIADQDRLASLGMLSASVAHELNNPLAVLIGSVEKLMESENEPARQERLKRIHRVAQRLQTISESFVYFARPRGQEATPVAVRTSIEEAWGLVEIDEKASQVHLTNLAEEGHQVLGNADRLVQVFLNLLRNALHAVKPGGHITVRSSRGVLTTGAWVTVSVEDDGPGIPPDMLPGIFEAFVTSRLDARGTGLGLAVAEGIVQQHGGSIAARNRPEGGALLEVVLPAAEPESEAGGGNEHG